MVNIFTIQRSNVIRLVNTTNYATNLLSKNFDNILLRDEIFTKQSITQSPYWQKYNQGDQIVIQIITNYTDINNNINNLSYLLTNCLKAFDYYNNPINLSGLVQIESQLTYGDGVTQSLNWYINTAGLLGNVYFKLMAGFSNQPYIEFTSELIDIGNYSNLPLLQWSGSRFDGVVYGKSILYPDWLFGFRIEAEIRYQSGDDSIVYKNYDFSNISLRQVPLRFWKLIFDAIPRYIAEKVVIASTHDDVYVNGLLLTKKDNGQEEQIELTNLYNFDITLQEQEYESYFNLPDQGGTIATQHDLTWDGSFGILISPNVFIRVY